MSSTILKEVRQSLLEEARKSPSLLADLAGLEQYVAESYDARSFVELLQNADDAGASRFIVYRAGNFLLVANDGRSFNRTDFESLCRSAASHKHRGTSIGYRGIGFKSVVGFAETIYVFSGELEATFSRERTAEEIPEASRVPLVRVPHPVESEERAWMAEAFEAIAQGGYRTIFVFTNLIASGIEAEFAAFDPTSLLFLRHIRQVELRSSIEEMITARRETLDTRSRSIRLASSGGTYLWRVVERAEIALAFAQEEEAIKRLEEREAVVHAFLPTHEATGLPIKINGDISTDPSRTRVILDERTAVGIEGAARLIVDLIAEALDESSDPVAAGLVASLVPFRDPRTAIFQRRSFKTQLLEAIKRVAEDRFENLRYRPSWLNPVDFEMFAAASNIRAVPRRLEEIAGLSGFLEHLGAKEATLADLRLGFKNSVPSLLGAAEVVSRLASLHATKQISEAEIDTKWRLWPLDDEPVTFEEVRRVAKPLNQSFVDMVSEKVGVSSELRRLVASLSEPETASRVVPEQLVNKPQPPEQAVHSPRSEGLPPGTPPRRLSLKRWRSAEQQVLSLLELQGWKVEDVSRQNVGYDIEGFTPKGEEVFLEVKAIDNPGQPFTLTSNEEATARQRGDAYWLVVVRQAGANLEVAFIRDPANQLELTRQCRQWVWECSSYEYNPEKFLLE